MSSPSSSRGGSSTSTSGYSSNENTLTGAGADGQDGASSSKSSRPRAGSDSSSGKNAVTKVMDMFRYRSNSAISSEDKMKVSEGAAPVYTPRFWSGSPSL